MKVFGVIMAGGGGTRFWPLSRKSKPKQLLNLSGQGLMINETIDRLGLLIDPKDIFIVTSQEQEAAMQEAAAGRLPPENILAEPAARNTAACIGYAAVKIKKLYGDGVMVIVPADHYIREAERLKETLQKGVDCAQGSDHLFTVGIEPSFPSTGYGYIQCDMSSQEAVKPVLAFHEKPDEETARRYIQSGGYKWNSGMFIWRVSAILRKYAEMIPDIHADLMRVYEALDTPEEQKTLQAVYPQIRRISVDYAIMEPCSHRGHVRMLPASFDWNDVGSWDMLSVYHAPDQNGNVLVGDTLALNSSQCVCYSQKRLVAVVDVQDLAVIETEDAIMVCPVSKAQDVRLLVEELARQGRNEVL